MLGLEANAPLAAVAGRAGGGDDPSYNPIWERRYGMPLMNRHSVAFVAALMISIPLLQACAPTATRESTGEYVDDSAITAKIKTKLLGDPIVSGFAVSVETFRGRVVLSGFVNSQAQIDRAIALTREVPGVREVQSALVIKGK